MPLKRLRERLRTLRKARGLSGSQLAAKAKVNQTYIYHIELGRYTPSLQMLERLAKALDLELEDFFRADGVARAETPPAYLDLAHELARQGVDPDSVRALVTAASRVAPAPARRKRAGAGSGTEPDAQPAARTD